MVQRYELKEDCVTGHIDLVEDAAGAWVGYEDYAALEAKYRMIAGHFIKAKQYQDSCKPELMDSAIWQAYWGWKKLTRGGRNEPCN